MKNTIYTNIFFVLLMAFIILAGCITPRAETAMTETQNAPSQHRLTSEQNEITDAPTQENAMENNEGEALPLSGNGPYAVGIRRNIIYVDEKRGGREISLTIWYPALSEDGESDSEIKDAPPDLSDAPYPVLLSTSKLGFIFAPALVSHGYVYVGVNKLDTYMIWDNNLVDQPLDLLFALKMVAEDAPEWLAGMPNMEMTGTLGYSFDGYNSLAMSGARVEPQAYLAHCAEIESMRQSEESWYWDYLCSLSQNWAEFEAHAGEEITDSQDGLWQPMTDARIKAVMPMSPDGAWLFNERGLAQVEMPIFITAAENEEFYSTEEMHFLYDKLGSADKYLITFLDRTHMMIYDEYSVSQLTHFANAFFGFYLQGKKDYAQYFSQDFVSQYSELAWEGAQDN